MAPRPKELRVALPASGRTVSIVQKAVDIDSGAISGPHAVERQRNMRARRDRGHHVQQSAVGECRYGHEVKHDLAAGAERNRCLASGNPDDTIGSKGGDALGDPRRLGEDVAQLFDVGFVFARRGPGPKAASVLVDHPVRRRVASRHPHDDDSSALSQCDGSRL